MERESAMRTMKSSLRHPVRGKQLGFTIVELVAILSLLGVLGSLAFLQLKPLLAQVRLNSGARQIAADLQVARMKAVAQNRRFRVTFRPVEGDYVVDREDGVSWRRLILHGHTPDGVDSAAIPLPSGVSITTVNSGGDVIFVPRGHVDGGITITLSSHTGAVVKRIIVNLAGRVRIE
ncbi:MAG: GspH/FimT family pseudopilin [Candidatus Binatia bacterium]